MALCKHCGNDAWPNRFLCTPCRRTWWDRRKAAWAQAQSEIGPLTAETHKALVKRTKQLERAAEKGEGDARTD